MVLQLIGFYPLQYDQSEIEAHLRSAHPKAQLTLLEDADTEDTLVPFRCDIDTEQAAMAMSEVIDVLAALNAIESVAWKNLPAADHQREEFLSSYAFRGDEPLVELPDTTLPLDGKI